MILTKQEELFEQLKELRPGEFVSIKFYINTRSGRSYCIGRASAPARFVYIQTERTKEFNLFMSSIDTTASFMAQADYIEFKVLDKNELLFIPAEPLKKSR